MAHAGRCSLGGLERSAGPGGGGGQKVSAKMFAEALAILMVDLVEVLTVVDRDVVLERLANRLYDQASVLGGRETAILIGQIGAALMRLEN